jgi:hypothetical protein
MPSSSSGENSRPRLWTAVATDNAVPQATIFVQAAIMPFVSADGSASSTSLPRPASRRAASSTAAMHSGCIGSPVSDVREKAMRSLGAAWPQALRNVPWSGGAA